MHKLACERGVVKLARKKPQQLRKEHKPPPPTAAELEKTRKHTERITQERTQTFLEIRREEFLRNADIGWEIKHQTMEDFIKKSHPAFGILAAQLAHAERARLQQRETEHPLIDPVFTELTWVIKTLSTFGHRALAMAKDISVAGVRLHRISRVAAANLLGVHQATVARWVNEAEDHDPEGQNNKALDKEVTQEHT